MGPKLEYDSTDGMEGTDSRDIDERTNRPGDWKFGQKGQGSGLTHPFNKYLLSTYYIPNNILCAKNIGGFTSIQK